HRRWLERVKDTPTLTEADVLAEQQARDARDSAREIAPLAPAADAVILDTTHLGLDDAIAAALQAVAAALEAPKT
ncbi:MAG: (d)CMP kinase, partial [Paracoccaceae bacterium]|nr:(d)CMP kinase [Paracoccaceae bacterium]